MVCTILARQLQHTDTQVVHLVCMVTLTHHKTSTSVRHHLGHKASQMERHADPCAAAAAPQYLFDLSLSFFAYILSSARRASPAGKFDRSK